MKSPLHALSMRIAIASVLLALGCVAASTGLVRWAKIALPPLTAQLGEVHLTQAEHREAAGALSEALDMYRRALNGTFLSAIDRNHCEKRIGVVLLQLGRHEEALGHLLRAQSEPERSLNGFAPLVTTLLALGRNTEARVAAEQWLAASALDPVNAANAHEMLGELALIGGDLDAVEIHAQAALLLNDRHAARALLAQLHAARGESIAACDVMADYLSTASPDENTSKNWNLLATWLSQKAAPE